MGRETHYEASGWIGRSAEDTPSRRSNRASARTPCAEYATLPRHHPAYAGLSTQPSPELTGEGLDPARCACGQPFSSGSVDRESSPLTSISAPPSRFLTVSHDAHSLSAVPFGGQHDTPSGEGVIWCALGAATLELHYQPIVDLSSLAIVGVEGLLRAPPPGSAYASGDGRIVSVGSQANDVEALGAWVAARACADALAWAGRGITTFINMSPQQLARPGLSDDLGASLALTGLPPSHLTVEVTEVSPLTRTAIAAAWDLHRMGVSIVLDDFGTNASDATALRDLPVSMIKVDRALIRHLRIGTRRHDLLSRAVRSAHRIGMRVVAEGIESNAEAAAAHAAGVDLGQGFYYSRPLPLAGAADLIASDRRQPSPALSLLGDSAAPALGRPHVRPAVAPSSARPRAGAEA